MSERHWPDRWVNNLMDGSRSYGEVKRILETLHGLGALVNPDMPTSVVEKAAKYDAINTPEIHDFIKAVEFEALHQRERWGSDHDAGKTDHDWFWLIGYLAGKALHKPEKRLHHIITTAAACLNWHAHAIGAHARMRPGIGPDQQPPKPAEPTA